MTQDQDAGTDKDPLKEYVKGGANYSEGIGGTAYDAATAALGTGYRMPTQTEFAELANTSNCTWEWYAKDNTEFNGVAGYKVTSKKEGFTGNSIFLPAAGHRYREGLSDGGLCGRYWSSSPNSGGANYAYYLYFDSGDVDPVSRSSRYYGFPVRPVYDGPDTTPTAIESINTDKAQKAVKTIENGKVVIIRGDKKYDLSGREL